MLPVMQRLASVGLTALQQQGVAAGADGERLGAHHAMQVQSAAGELAHRHQHAPVDAPDLVVAARAALVIVLEEGVAVGHQDPGTRHDVPGPHGRGVGEPGGTGAHAGHGNAEGALRHATLTGHAHGIARGQRRRKVRSVGRRRCGALGRVVMFVPDLGRQARRAGGGAADSERERNEEGHSTIGQAPPPATGGAHHCEVHGSQPPSS